MNTIPNILIFRLPLTAAEGFEFDESFGESPPAFVQMDIVDGKLDPVSAQIFTVGEDDSYRTIGTDQLIFAEFNGHSSRQLCSFSVIDEDKKEAVIWDIGIHQLNQMLPTFLHEIEHVMASKNQVVH